MSMLLARLWLKIWRFTSVPPPDAIPDRCVMIAAPHTTNWDFPIMLALTKVAGVRVSWLGKRSLFKGPMGTVMRWLGGVAIDRSAAGGMVAALAHELTSRDKMMLMVPAEGTRTKTDYWKSGFYRIAVDAQVPIVLAFVDRNTRTGGFGPCIMPSGDVRADMDKIRAFYHGMEGLKPGRFGPVRLKEEAQAE
jgi:1-acyl-sn-glycerol-3-phosphate acyltransferase